MVQKLLSFLDDWRFRMIENLELNVAVIQLSADQAYEM